jgi:hypothetical protein
LAIFAAIRRASSRLSKPPGSFQQHRVAIAGNGGPIYVAQLALNVDNTGTNEQ